MSLILLLFISLILLFIIFHFYIAIKGHKLFTYLKRNKQKRWEEVSKIGESGPGMYNFFELVAYSFSDKDNDDENIVKLKSYIRKGLIYSVLILILISLTFCLLIIGIKKGL